MARVSFVVWVLLGLACAEPEPTCGDGLCDSQIGESNATCSSDCHSGGDPFSCGPCPPLMACPPARGPCLPAFMNGSFLIGVTEATLPGARPDGSPWDANHPPDPYAVVTLRGVLLGTTSAIPDTTAPMWNASVGEVVSLAKEDEVRFDVFDEDGASDELMFTCTRIFEGFWPSYGMPDAHTLTGYCTGFRFSLSWQP